MAHKLDDKICYSVLDYVRLNPGRVVETFLKEKHNIIDSDLAELYRIKLEQDGYLSTRLVGSANKYISHLTDKGKLLLGTGSPENLVKKVADEIKQKNLQNSSKEASFVVSNKNKINEALENLYYTQKKIEEDKSLIPGDIRSISNNIDVILRKVFLPEHEIFKSAVKGSGDKRKVLEVLTDGITHLEFELLDSHSDLSHIHPLILNASEKQFLNKDYRGAVNNAFTAVVEFLKLEHKATSKGKLMDGAPLMENLFNSNNPLVRFSNDNDKQDGIKMIYLGAILAFRNKHIHNLKEIEDENYALDLLHLASLLMRLAEDPKLY